jgi:ferredoxin-NADP reductase
VLDTNSSKPIVLISNGVGITPMIAMAKAALGQPSPRPIWFLHGCRNGPFHAFRDEMASLADAHSNLHLHIAYSRPREEDAGHHQSEGYVDWALIKSLVDQDADYFLCGSPPFMQGLIAELRQAGIPEAAIHFEMFSSKPPASSSTSEAAPEASSMADATPGTTEVTFARSGRTATWASTDPEDTLLAFAETQGLEPAFACRAGVCGTCACRVLEGEVSYISEATAGVATGSALICIARPQGAIVKLDL